MNLEERRERIDSVLDEILSVPRLDISLLLPPFLTPVRLVEANLTQRNLSNPRQMSRSGRRSTLKSTTFYNWMKSEYSSFQVPGRF